jgi:hypothetical protein
MSALRECLGEIPSHQAITYDVNDVSAHRVDAGGHMFQSLSILAYPMMT